MITQTLHRLALVAADVADTPGAPEVTGFDPDNHIGPFWMPPPVSTLADGVDTLYYGILGLTIFCFVAITGALVYFVWKYRARPGHHAEPSPSHNDVLEITWTIIPSIICVFIFVAGWEHYIDMSTPPKHAIEVNVTGRAWQWQFETDGLKDDVLHAPVNKPVKMIMTSVDFLHSMFVPAFRIKQDVVPGRYTYLWFQATQPGTYRVFCAEYCGKDHSLMKTTVIVHPPGGYERYMDGKKQELLNMPPVELGEMLYGKLGCKNCHRVDGTPYTAPAFNEIWGRQEKLADGSTVLVDENYLRESLEDPAAKVVAGFQPLMPSFKGQLSEKEIVGLIAYIKSLSATGKAELDAAPSDPAQDGAGGAAVPPVQPTQDDSPAAEGTDAR